tara:strand:- start:133 stop:378 length:246 start_codon:yes stop_codon:yes gene_type:complete
VEYPIGADIICTGILIGTFQIKRTAPGDRIEDAEAISARLNSAGVAICAILINLATAGDALGYALPFYTGVICAFRFVLTG